MNLISQINASKIVGVSKQAINKLKNKSSYDFFVGNKVDTDHPHWKSYLHERGLLVEDQEEKIELKKSKNKVGGKASKKKQVDELKKMIPVEEHEILDDIVNEIPGLEKEMLKQAKKMSKKETRQAAEYEQKHALTGGVNPDDFKPRNIQDVKRLGEISDLNLKLRIRLSELVEKEILIPMLDSMSQTVQSYFVDFPRKISTTICKKLDRIGMEKEVEKILAEPIAKGIKEFKKAAAKAGKVRNYK